MNDTARLAADMTENVQRFLGALTSEQRKKATLPFQDTQERRTWYYTPTARPGLPLLEMSPTQQQNVTRLLAVGLSEGGYNSVATVMGFENLVDYTSGFGDRNYGGLPGTRTRDPLNYCVAVFGEPGDRDGWSWRIGGHHVALHYTLHGDDVSPLPAFFGAEPSHAPMPGGVLLRPLAAEEDLARGLLLMLTPDQRERAVISPIAPTDIVQRNNPRIEDGALPQIGGGGPGGQGLRDQLGLTPAHDEMYRYSTTPKGVLGADLTQSQREALVRLVSVYYEHLPAAIADAATARLCSADNLAATSFAWAGPADVGAPHYYRVQGARLLIEYDCTQNSANHTHSVLRDPEGDFGDDILAQHYAAAH